MFSTINFRLSKKTVFTVVFILLAVISLVFIISCFTDTEAQSTLGTKRTIVIDAGHGGIDGGTVGVNTGNKESDLNLLIAFELKELLSPYYNVVLTRKDKNLLSDLTSGFKKEDMKKRAEIIENSSPTLVVSIHMNKYSLRYRRGAQVYYQSKDDDSTPLADAVQSSLNGLNAITTGKTYQAQQGDFYICRVSPCPAVIVECGFLSNPEDDALLNTASYRKKVANAIYEGIAEHIAINTLGDYN